MQLWCWWCRCRSAAKFNLFPIWLVAIFPKQISIEQLCQIFRRWMCQVFSVSCRTPFGLLTLLLECRSELKSGMPCMLYHTQVECEQLRMIGCKLANSATITKVIKTRLTCAHCLYECMSHLSIRGNRSHTTYWFTNSRWLGRCAFAVSVAPAAPMDNT